LLHSGTRMKISLIATGGTIVSEFDSSRSIRTSGDHIGAIQSILQKKPDNYPDLSPSIISPFTLLSENMIIQDYPLLAGIINKEIERGAEAIVITHGTDTMTYTIAAISLLFRDIKIPIIFTGSFYPYNHPKSNAAMNVWNSILFACKIRYPGIYLAFGSDKIENKCILLWGPRTTCLHFFSKNFESIDKNHIAHILNGKVFINNDYTKTIRHTASKEDNHTNDFSPHVAMFELYPSFDPNILLTLINTEIKIILLKLYHSGTASIREGLNSRYSLRKAIITLKENNIAVFGHPVPIDKSKRYKSTTALIKDGLIPIGNMPFEMALMKLRWFLQQGMPIKAIKAKINTPIVSEIIK
jgi:L-asparaginase/Glu-tRNA(Gln) amidotransferase subunit D